MSLAEIEKAVDALTPDDLAKLSAYIARRESASWDAQIDTDFSEGGRLRSVLEEVKNDLRTGPLDDVPS